MEFSEKISSVCFTGHRDLTEKEIYIISKRLTTLLIHLILHHGLRDCFAGGAIGQSAGKRSGSAAAGGERDGHQSILFYQRNQGCPEGGS